MREMRVGKEHAYHQVSKRSSIAISLFKPIRVSESREGVIAFSTFVSRMCVCVQSTEKHRKHCIHFIGSKGFHSSQ